MAERSEKDRERLERVYQRMARLPDVDVNDPDNIIIALDKENEHYRDRIRNAEEVIKGLRSSLAAASKAPHEAVQDNTATEIIKALAENGFDTITINAYKSKKEENSND